MSSTSWTQLREVLLPDRIKQEKLAWEEANRKSQGRKSIITDRSVSFKHGNNTPSPDGRHGDPKKKTMSKLSPKTEGDKILLIPNSTR